MLATGKRKRQPSKVSRPHPAAVLHLANPLMGQTARVERERKRFTPANTKVAYGPKQVEWFGYCDKVYPNCESSHVVTEPKLFAFLYYQSFRPHKARGGRKKDQQPSGHFDFESYKQIMAECDSDLPSLDLSSSEVSTALNAREAKSQKKRKMLQIQALDQYYSAVKQVWDRQRQDGMNNIPESDFKNSLRIKALKMMVQGRKHVLMRENHEERPNEIVMALERVGTAVQDKAYTKAMKKACSNQGIRSDKWLHYGRKNGPVELEMEEVDQAEIKSIGYWNRKVYDTVYSLKLPLKAMRVANGYGERGTHYNIRSCPPALHSGTRSQSQARQVSGSCQVAFEPKEEYSSIMDMYNDFCRITNLDKGGLDWRRAWEGRMRKRLSRMKRIVQEAELLKEGRGVTLFQAIEVMNWLFHNKSKGKTGPFEVYLKNLHKDSSDHTCNARTYAELQLPPHVDPSTPAAPKDPTPLSAEV